MLGMEGITARDRFNKVVEGGLPRFVLREAARKD
jgi:hypothetical protein